MQIEDKAAYAILTCKGWRLHRRGYLWTILDTNEFDVLFWKNDSMMRHFVSLEDACVTLRNADFFYDSIGYSYQNPWLGLSDHEILVKCDLERNT